MSSTPGRTPGVHLPPRTGLLGGGTPRVPQPAHGRCSAPAGPRCVSPVRGASQSSAPPASVTPGLRYSGGCRAYCTHPPPSRSCLPPPELTPYLVPCVLPERSGGGACGSPGVRGRRSAPPRRTAPAPPGPTPSPTSSPRGAIVLKPCASCGELSSSTYCEAHEPRRDRSDKSTRASAHRRGYGRKWQALSREARRLQPWCSDCGTAEDLTADHLVFPALTLRDVDVVCRSCNSKREPIRGERGVGRRSRPGEETLRAARRPAERRADP